MIEQDPGGSENTLSSAVELAALYARCLGDSVGRIRLKSLRSSCQCNRAKDMRRGSVK